MSSPELQRKLLDYVHGGGKVIGTYMSMDNGCDETNPLYGNRMLGDSYWDRDFIMPNDEVGARLPKEEFVMYERGARVRTAGSQVLLDSVEPYFNREGKYFCSHQHAPSTGRVGFPAATRYGDVVYFSHPLFRIYKDFAPSWVKAIFADVLDLLMPRQLVRKDDGHTVSGLEVQLRRSGSRNSLMLHCLYYPCKKSAANLYTIDEKVPLFDQRVRVYVGDAEIESVRAIRQGEVISERDYTVADGYVELNIPKIDGYEIIELSLK